MLFLFKVCTYNGNYAPSVNPERSEGSSARS